MAKWKAGDRVKIIKRAVTDADRESNSYYAHLTGLTGAVQNVYGKDEVAVRVDSEAFGSLLSDVHKEAVKRMRLKFLDSMGEEQKRKLSKEERRFSANYVVLVRSADLEKGPAAPKAKAKVEEEDDLEGFDPTSVKEDVLYDDASVPESPRRKKLAEIEAAEEKELKRRRN